MDDGRLHPRTRTTHSNHEPMLARLRSPSDTVLETSAATRMQPKIAHTPDLPAINWDVVGRSAPTPLSTPGEIPLADAVVITWTEAEWAALEHVFCGSGREMSYGARTDDSWSGWQLYTKSIPTIKGWPSWGEFRCVQIDAAPVLLFKSNTHLDFPGERYLEQLLRQLLASAKPKLVLSTGTAGGARATDFVGTVNVTNAATLSVSGQPLSRWWPTYKSAWQPNWTLANSASFAKLLLPVPTTQSDLTEVCAQFNAFYKSTYVLNQLNVGGLDMAKGVPAINNLTAASVPLLSTNSFVVGNQRGNLADFAGVEMDDAIIAKVCSAADVSFGFIRNISDPVQNASLPPEVEAHWAQAIYDAYGFYTSFNSALVTWAVLAADYM
jgi:nucleoside phosphorylase